MPSSHVLLLALILYLLPHGGCVKIGVLWPKTRTDLTQAAQAAVEVYKKNVNPSWPIEVDYSTNAVEDSTKVHTELCAMLRKGGYSAFLGPVDSVQTSYVAYTVSKHQIPLISPGARSDLLGESDESYYTYLRRTSGTLKNESKAFGFFFKAIRNGLLLDARTIVVGADNDRKWQEFSRIVHAELSLAKANILFVNASITSTAQYAALFESMLKNTVQVVVLVGSKKGVQELLEHAVASPMAMKPGIVWMVSEEAAAPGVLPPSLRQQCTGLLGVRQLGSGAQSTALLEMQATLGRSFGNSLEERRAYDAMTLVLQALRSADLYRVAPQVSAQCTTPSVLWREGVTLLNEMDKIQLEGASGVVHVGSETGQDYELLNMVKGEWKTVGEFIMGSETGNVNNVQFLNGKEPTSQDILNGRHLRILFIQFKPFVYKDENGKDVGLVFDLINELARRLNFTYDKTVQVGNWSGGIDLVSLGKYDLQAADTGITEERERKVDFTQPYIETTSVLMLRRPRVEASIWRFLEPFDKTVWLALVITVLASAVVFWALEGGCLAKDISEREWGESYIPKGKHGIENAVWFVCSAMVQLQGSEPITRSGRVMGLGLFWLAVITIATYTAELAAYLATAPATYPVEEIDEFIDGAVPLSKLGVMPGTVNANWIEKQVGTGYYPLENDGDEELLAGDLIATVQDSIWADFFTQQHYDPPPHVCPGTKAPTAQRTATVLQTSANTKHARHARTRHASVAVVGSRRMGQVLKGGGPAGSGVAAATVVKLDPIDGCSVKDTCAFELRGTGWNPRGVGLPLQKGSPFTRALSQEILALRENNFISELQDKWFAGECTEAEEVEEGDAMGVKRFAGVFILYGAMAALAFLTRLSKWVFRSNSGNTALQEKPGLEHTAPLIAQDEELAVLEADIKKALAAIPGITRDTVAIKQSESTAKEKDGRPNGSTNVHHLEASTSSALQRTYSVPSSTQEKPPYFQPAGYVSPVYSATLSRSVLSQPGYSDQQPKQPATARGSSPPPERYVPGRTFDPSVSTTSMKYIPQPSERRVHPLSPR